MNHWIQIVMNFPGEAKTDNIKSKVSCRPTLTSYFFSFGNSKLNICFITQEITYILMSHFICLHFIDILCACQVQA